jgi:hypothetical protein
MHLSRHTGITLANTLAILAFACTFSAGLARADMRYENLPAEAKTYAENVRSSCKESNPEGVPADKMAGITPVTLSDGTPALILDNEALCADHYSGANCTNRGCDAVVMIAGEDADRGWKEIFHEHLYEKTFNMGEGNKLRSIAAWVYAGDPHCKATSTTRFMAKDSCSVEIRYQNKRWNWQRTAGLQAGASGEATVTSAPPKSLEPVRPGQNSLVAQAAPQSSPAAQAATPPSATAGRAAFQALSPDQQATITQEADLVEKNCKSDTTYSAYHECTCLKAKFVDSKSQQPTQSRHNISFAIRKECVNSEGIRSREYDYCFNSASRMLARKYTDEERPAMCKCYAEQVTKNYSKSPDPSYRYITQIQVQALTSCAPK